MNDVPEQPKFPVAIVIRPLLVSGMLADGGNGRVDILIDAEQPAAVQLQALMHETIHLLLMAAGRAKSIEHDEVRIDEMAKRLADAAPDLVELLGISEDHDDVASSAPRLG